MKGEDEERQGEERGEMGKEGEGREEEKREEEEERTKGDERTVDAPGDANDRVVMSWSADHLHSTTMIDQSVGPHDSSTPTTSLEPMPMYPSAHPKSVQPPATTVLWCNPVTVMLEQIEENTQCLLHEWPKDDGILFPMEVLDMLNDLRTKVRSRDEERAQKTKLLTMADPPTEILAQRADATLGMVKTTMQVGQAKEGMNEERPTREDEPTN